MKSRGNEKKMLFKKKKDHTSVFLQQDYTNSVSRLLSSKVERIKKYRCFSLLVLALIGFLLSQTQTEPA